MILHKSIYALQLSRVNSTGFVSKMANWSLGFKLFIIYFQGDAATVEFQYIATLFLYDALEVESFFNSVIFIFKLG